MRKNYILVGIVLVTAAILVIAKLAQVENEGRPASYSACIITVNLLSPTREDNNPAGFASISFPSGTIQDPESKLNSILAEYSSSNGKYSGQYYTWRLVENKLENGEEMYRYDIWDIPDNRLNPYIPTIRQDNIGERFCFYSEWGVAYISEPVVFGMTVILPPGYEVENVRCSDPYVITSEDNRAKVVVENASMDRDFDLFTLRIDYRKV